MRGTNTEKRSRPGRHLEDKTNKQVNKRQINKQTKNSSIDWNGKKRDTKKYLQTIDRLHISWYCLIFWNGFYQAVLLISGNAFSKYFFNFAGHRSWLAHLLKKFPVRNRPSTVKLLTGFRNTFWTDFCCTTGFPCVVQFIFSFVQ